MQHEVQSCEARREEATAEDRRPELVDRAHHPHGEPSEDSCVGRSHARRVHREEGVGMGCRGR